jgi:DNA-binding NarL/FixJ family response regulator
MRSQTTPSTWASAGRRLLPSLVSLGRQRASGISADTVPSKQAIYALDTLGAEAALRRARRRMKELGIGNIPRGPRPDTKSGPAGLTAREQMVLALLIEGLPDKEISHRLVVSERTVHHHVSAILSKIGVTSRSAAAREAVRMGIGTPI